MPSNKHRSWWIGIRHESSKLFATTAFTTTTKLVKRFNVLQRITFKKLITTLCVVLIVISGTILISSVSFKKPVILTCHYVVDGDALLSTEAVEFMPPSGSIFFHETLCKGVLNSRQACSVESAARVHPEREVYVLFSGPVTNNTLENSILAKLQEIPNIHLARIHIEEYAKGTPLESLVVKDNLLLSSSPMEYVSNILRFLTLRKWSGVYLDMDMLVAKELGPLGMNWIACEDHERVNSAAVAISRDEIGINISNEIIREMAKSYNPKNLSWSEPDAVMMRVLRQRCSKSDVYEWSNDSCRGFQVWAPSFVFPVHYSHSDEYFKVNATIGDILAMSTYAYHLWNNRTRNLKVVRDTLYDNLAKEFCPTVYNTNLFYLFNE